MHPTTVFAPLALVLAGKAWSSTHTPALPTTGKADAIPVTLTARAMATPVPDDQMKLAVRSVNNDYKCAWNVTYKTESCPSDNTACFTLEEMNYSWHTREECDKDPDFSEISDTTPTVIKAGDDYKCTWKRTRDIEACPSNNAACFRTGKLEDVYYSLEECAIEPDLNEIFDTTPTVIKASSAKAVVIPVSLKARALATPNPWDDLGPVMFRTERPETAIHEIDPRQVSMSTMVGTQTMTMAGTGTTTMTFATTTTSEVVVATVIEITATTETSAAMPSTTSTTPITTTTSAPTGTPMTTISNLTPGMNTVQVPMQSAAPVVVISAPSDSYSSGYTTETVWSSVWEPRNTPISTVTRPVAYYVPQSNPTQTPASTGKSSGASTARSGAGVIVMAGVGALAACFMMF